MEMYYIYNNLFIIFYKSTFKIFYIKQYFLFRIYMEYFIHKS